MSFTTFGQYISLAPLVDHLWQSTFLVIIAFLLVLALRRNRASVRYGIWLTASMKFLLPFSLLLQAGQALRPAAVAPVALQISAFTAAVDQVARPFSQPRLDPPHAPSLLGHLRELLPNLLAALWFCGSLAVALQWWRKRQRVRNAVRAASSSRTISAEIPVLCSASSLEPGVFGVFKPVLLLPAGITDRLTPPQLRTILAHEMCHVRRRDNLTSTLHMLVQALFWFYPLIWWIGTRLVDERERACDEHVLSLGSDPQAYAEGILKVCNFYLESPLFCAAGVTGSNLKKRIEAIMTHRTVCNLGSVKKIVLTAVGAAALLVPLGFGVLHAAQNGPNSQTPPIVTASFYNAPPLRVYEAVSVRPSQSAAVSTAEFRPDGFAARNVTLQTLIEQAYGVAPYQIAGAPDWFNHDRYDVEATIDDAQADELSKGDVNELSARQQPMLLELLADRFRLSVHRETRQLPAYALIVSKNGPKLREATPGDTYPDGFKDANGNAHAGVMSLHRGQLIGQGIPLEFLAQQLSRQLGRPVLDKTGLTGNYDFTLQWSNGHVFFRDYIVVPGTSDTASKSARVDSPASTNAQSAELSGPSIFTAVQEQLGLELVESNEQTAPAQILVVDHAERPPRDGSATQLQSRHPLAFASVSIEPNINDTVMPGFKISGKPFNAVIAKPNRFMANNFTLRGLIRLAYSVQDFQIAGAPDWLNSEKFDVDAKVDDDVAERTNALGDDQKNLEMKAMLEKLLADHFKLAFHRETRQIPGYTLSVADAGSQLQAAKPESFSPSGKPIFKTEFSYPERGALAGKAASVSNLISELSRLTGQPVVDKTDLTGSYDFTLHWTPDASESPAYGSSILLALEQQLGLKLESQTNLVEVLVIDHAEQPSKN